ncbi:MAG: hypothetical protein HQL99_14235 [Magnetococcales bacterium]|nr:hypothetical protein [Magnetococcales bacterium]
MNKQFLIERAREPSTWRGAAMMLTAVGVSVSPESMNDIVAVGTGLAGLIGVFTGDSAKDSAGGDAE